MANVATANHGETKVNTVTVTYLDADNNVETKTASVPITLTEPLLIVQKIGVTRRMPSPATWSCTG